MGDGVVVAIDQGTTGNRVLVFDRSGRVLGQAYAEFRQHYPQPAWVEHDAAEIWEEVQRLFSGALERAKVGASDVRAIGITNQRETVVFWERATGKPVARAIVWQDRRTADACAAIKAEGLEGEFRRRTGLTVDPYFSGTKAAWLLEHTQDLRERAERGEIAMGTMDCWLVWNLTGGAHGGVHATDPSNASRTLLYNIHTGAWDLELLSWLGVPAAVLPEVRPSSGVFGSTRGDGFLGAAVPVTGVAGDQQAALFGQGCFAPGDCKNTYGTGSFVLQHTGRAPVESKDLLSTVAWRIGEEPAEYALEGSVFVTGAAVQWLRDGLRLFEDASETAGLALSVASNEGVYFVPALTGLGAPHWDPYARGLIVGLTRGTTRAHLVRAAIEAMCYQTRDVIEAMRAGSGLDLRDLRVDGGATENPVLMQFQADLLGVPVQVAAVRETTALGAAFLAGLAVGYWKDRGEIKKVLKAGTRYEPAWDRAQVERWYARWKKAVELAKGWEAGADELGRRAATDEHG